MFLYNSVLLYNAKIPNQLNPQDKNHMKSNSNFSRYSILWMIILCYLIPIIGIISYRFIVPNSNNDWMSLSVGILLSMAGSIAIFWLMTRWESSLKTPETPSLISTDIDISSNEKETSIQHSINLEEYLATSKALEDSLDNNNQLQAKIQSLTEHIEGLSINNEKAQEETQQILSEFEQHRNVSLDQLAQQQHLIRELQDIVAEQKNSLEKRQQQVGQLETKVGDLTYEIKTLLKLAETHTSLSDKEPIKETPPIPPIATRAKLEEPIHYQTEKHIRTPDEASIQLKRCLDISQKITGSYRFNNHSNMFIDSTADSYTLDLRRLCDSLRSETGCTILLYSPKDHQLLFVNNQIKTLTGWSPEKFTQNFSEILQDNTAWKQGISNLAIRNEIQMKLTLKMKTAQETSVMAHLGMIPTGIFRHHAIAVLYPLT